MVESPAYASEQLAKPFRLFPALDFQDLGSRRGEQFLSRLNAGYPARRFLFVFCHDTFLNQRNRTLLEKIR